MVAVSCVSFLGCGSDGTNAGGVGGSGGSGGLGGGGIGGTGGTGGTPLMCMNPRDCDDMEPCTNDLCVEQVCAYESLPDNAVCVSDTGLSVCLTGECQIVWPSCTDEGAEEGDFCEPTEEVDRIGRCPSEGECEVGPCEIAFDCWDGNGCTSGICDPTDCTCSQENAPNGTVCIPPVGGQCVDGTCAGGAGGQGGSGGT